MEDDVVFDAKIQKVKNVVRVFIDIASSYFFPQSKASSMLCDGSVGASKFVSLSWALWLYYFYGLIMAYFLYEELISSDVRINPDLDLFKKNHKLRYGIYALA